MATRAPKKRLPDMLLEQNLVTREQLQECINLHRQTGQSLPSLLVANNYLSEEDLVITLSEQLGIPHIRVAHYSIPKEVLRSPRNSRGSTRCCPSASPAMS